MNDITKARYFLNANKSELAELSSFGLMLSTAENKYKNLRLQKQGNRAAPGSLDNREIDAAVDLAVLRYLKKHNQLPKGVAIVLEPSTSPEEKKDLAMMWLYA